MLQAQHNSSRTGQQTARQHSICYRYATAEQRQHQQQQEDCQLECAENAKKKRKTAVILERRSSGQTWKNNTGIWYVRIRKRILRAV